MNLKQLAKSILPEAIVRQLSLSKRRQDTFAQLPVREAFTRIYADQMWGVSDDPNQPFYSGDGSRSGPVVDVYVAAVRDFLATLGAKPDVVDLGCGDFTVGSRIRQSCDRYVACDIVEPVIESNRARFAALDVDFRVLDFTTEAVPNGDVAFVRQVLQHLPNALIAQALPKLRERYRHLIVTESLPRARRFRPNVDKPAGPDIRFEVGSGVVLSAAPFNLRAKSEAILCEVEDGEGVIRTTRYSFV